MREHQRSTRGALKLPGELGAVFLDSPVRVLVCESNVGRREVIEEVMEQSQGVPDRSKTMNFC